MNEKTEHPLSARITRVEKKIDQAEEKLRSHELSVPTDLIGGIVFLIFGLVVLYIIPTQIEIKKKEIVNGRQFPNLLMYIMIACAIVLIISQIIKLLRHQEVARTKINLLTEVKALIIFADMLIYYFVSQWTDNFAIGSCVFVLLMMVFFRCKKISYYIITLSAAILIWAAFRFGLNVNF